MSWATVEDCNVRHVWASPDGKREVTAFPGVRAWDDGMVYVRTEVHMPPRRRKRHAWLPEARNDWCEHVHAPYRSKYGMPCTGPLQCTMCGMLLDPDTREPLPGQEGDD